MNPTLSIIFTAIYLAFAMYIEILMLKSLNFRSNPSCLSLKIINIFLKNAKN